MTNLMEMDRPDDHMLQVKVLQFKFEYANKLHKRARRRRKRQNAVQVGLTSPKCSSTRSQTDDTD